MFVPVNSTTTFRCSVTVGFTILWQVQLPGAHVPLPATTLLMPQLELTETSPTSSMLTIHDVTEDLNGTRVFCAAIISPEASEVLVIVYGVCIIIDTTHKY